MIESPVPWKVLSSKVGVGILTDGWNLAEADPDADEARSFAVDVTFDSPFLSVPVVQLGLSGFDLDQRDSARITLKAESITESGFQAVVSTWAGTRVFAIEFNWLAIGA